MARRWRGNMNGERYLGNASNKEVHDLPTNSPSTVEFLRRHQTEIDKDGDRYILRSQLAGVAGKVLQAVGVAVPPRSGSSMSRPHEGSDPSPFWCHAALAPS